MEMGHIEILEEIRKKDIKDIRIYDIQNLHISDYLIKPAPIGEMSYQDILIIAMKIEEASCKLYNSLAEKSNNKDIRKLFLKLASEESSYKIMFEKMYDDEILTQD